MGLRLVAAVVVAGALALGGGGRAPRAGDAAAPADATPPARADADDWITATIKTAFAAEESLETSDVRVDTSDGTVTLRGRVPSEAARMRALEIARSTEAVTAVVDRLAVAAPR